MIRRVQLDNVLSFKGFDWTPEAYNLLLGYTGAGKSTLLRALIRWVDLLEGRRSVRRLLPRDERNPWNPRPRCVFGIEIDGPDGRFGHRLEVEHGADSEDFRIISETVTLDGLELLRVVEASARLTRPDASIEPETRVDPRESLLARLPPGRGHATLTRLKHSLGRISWWSGQELNVRGQDFHLWLADRRHARPDLEPAFRLLLEDFQAGGLDPDDLQRLSTGERARIIASALAIWGTADTGMLLLDQPDLFLALPDIQPWAIEVVDRIHDHHGQLFCASHRAETIDFLHPEGAWWLDRQDSGPTSIRPLSASPVEEEEPLSRRIARGTLS